MKELLLITARLFKPGQLAATELVARPNTVWLFESPDASTLLDVAEFSSTRLAYEFFSPAVAFEIEILPAPGFAYPEWRSYIDMCIAETDCSLQVFFEVDAKERWYPLIQQKPSARAVQFYALYEVSVTVQRDEEDCKDASLNIDFIGELELERL